jgi:hypothetical protein
MASASSCGDVAGAGAGAGVGSGLAQEAALASHPAVQEKSMGSSPAADAASQSIGSAVRESCRELGGGARRRAAVGGGSGCGFGFESRVFPPLFACLDPPPEFELLILLRTVGTESAV